MDNDIQKIYVKKYIQYLNQKQTYISTKPKIGSHKIKFMHNDINY